MEHVGYQYAVEWSPERIDAYVDDSLYFAYINEGTGWETWPFGRPFHLILNVAVGGMWGRSGGGIDDSVFPQKMPVDCVRVYEQKPWLVLARGQIARHIHGTGYELVQG